MKTYEKIDERLTEVVQELSIVNQENAQLHDLVLFFGKQLNGLTSPCTSLESSVLSANDADKSLLLNKIMSELQQSDRHEEDYINVTDSPFKDKTNEESIATLKENLVLKDCLINCLELKIDKQNDQIKT